tara:strand:- start:387 stop:560 length:174 start_codon:yes stop_codon:yes gene_type:complete
MGRTSVRRSSAKRVETRVRIAAGVVLLALLGFIVSATRPESRPDRWISVEYEVQGLH